MTTATTGRALDEGTKLWLDQALHYLGQAQEQVAGGDDIRDCTLRVILRHALRDLRRVEADLDAALDERAAAEVEARHGFAPRGVRAPEGRGSMRRSLDTALAGR
jgi:hypothetical protein